ncbi:MAG: glutamate ligase domain-containing protein [Solirubrobacterales bacterium]
MSAEILRAREPLGWRLGLERMRRLCTLLGLPQHRFASIHVVGTNGKTSVARMIAGLLDAHGIRAGAYLSPHIRDWRERIVIAGEPIGDAAFAEALERAEEKARVADRAAGEDGPVTQFELLTAAAFLALATARVKIGVIEAGLGGRLDATNVIPSRATVLTSVGLDHTEWLGGTLAEIAAEKLAVLRDRSVLIRGELPAEAEAVAEREAARHHARMLGPAPLDGLPVGGLAPFQRANLALALRAAAEIAGDLRSEAVAAALASLSVPGRAQLIAGDPPLIVDAAHNADGAGALAAALPALAGGPVVCCVAVLEGKDAAAIASALAPHCVRVVCTAVPEAAIAAGGRPGGRSIPAPELAALFTAEGVEAEAVEAPEAAIERALALGRERSLTVLVTGSHFLLGSALASAAA